jgi:hypothetical protein
LWQRFKDQVSSASAQQVWTFLDDAGAPPFKSDDSYVRIVLTDMALSHDVVWFTSQYPSVNVSIMLGFGGTTQTLSGVAGPPKGALSPGSFKNYPMTPLIPYRGGTIEIAGGLVALAGDNRLGIVLDVLGAFSSLAAPVATTVEVAKLVNDGIEKLLDAGGSIRLGVHDGYLAPRAGACNRLRGGHLVVIRADTAKFETSKLAVSSQGLLTYGGHTLDGYDYLVFYVECVVDRSADDWHFPDLEALLNEARTKIVEGDDAGLAMVKKKLKALILTSPDLVEADRQRVMAKVKELLDAAEHADLGIAADDAPTLAAAMKAGRMDLADAQALGPLTFDVLDDDA